MGDMNTETLTGRDLDTAVARAMGYENVRDSKFQPPGLVGTRDGLNVRLPAYSAGNCSGLAPVLSWLAENAPTREQFVALFSTGWHPPDGHRALLVIWTADGVWYAGYCMTWVDFPTQPFFQKQAPTLPVAACRLLVAWAARKANGTSGTAPVSVR
jgi:hypothetical protein